ncbi:hypothetical protein DAI22_11g124500 [Oryza sativa Japonica Group]|uniref:Uncharacterized protein n=6 Tax=Oryza TaxID=4527 RepID=Q53JR4_ORYSJ|nr:hypothetical protein LOC_Os11g26580 [Oryza sativa Japonica Group]ABA93398.1 hypothetical protein LOC_Os11g26580 [Oryza sativa Japonica Group]KAF2910739.1 hypothetical protein DAI22_11g124500 [Oryza sativa Japonica Group]
MVKCMKPAYQGLMLFCLVLVVCSALPAQIRGQTIRKIGSNIPMGLKNVVSHASLNVCYQEERDFAYCCSKDKKCYSTISECLAKCTYN